MGQINNIKPLSILNKLFLTWFIACLGFTFQSNAQPGQALDFDATSDYVEVDQSSNSDLDITGSLTVSAWVKIDNNAGQSNIGMVSKWNGSKSSYILWLNFSGKPGLQVKKSGFSEGASANKTYDDGTWHHFAGVYDGSTVKFYVDGILEGTNTNAPNSINSNPNLDLTIGKHTDEFEGDVDEVRIWSEARTQQEIRDNMHKEISNPGSKSNLVGYYNFDNGSGSTLTDQAGSNDGTLKNSPTWVSSGARVGDKCTSTYAPSSSISAPPNLASSDGDDVDVTITGGDADAIKVIMLGNAPSNTSVDNSNLSSGSIQQISQDRFWIVHAVDPNSNFQYDFQYNFDGHSGINNQSDLRLVKRADFDAADWDAQNNKPTTSTTPKNIKLTGQAGSHYALGTINSSDPLPVELTQFKTQKTGEAVHLSWATASETNNSHFLIQRKQQEGGWQNLGEVQGHGTTTEPQEYSFNDPQPKQGNNYYRLKQVDFDGSYEFSGIRSVNFDQITKNDQLSVEVLENPAQRTLRLSITQDKAGRLPYQLLNSEGAPVKQGNWDLQPGKQQKRIGLYGLPSGIYFLKIRNEDQTILKKVVK